MAKVGQTFERVTGKLATPLNTSWTGITYRQTGQRANRQTLWHLDYRW
ncbi:hypothetical protein D3OALGB2SA_1559 [Olavius algarvensis associated proteobacterium Delta 3]|nr:hypothetical protein D3OALGB2SA_1559 [Olavius algarvensis associated proteobacterium Delta 3]